MFKPGTYAFVRLSSRSWRQRPRRWLLLHCERVISIAVGRFLEHDQQRKDGKHRDHQQLVIVDVGDDLCLLRDYGIERGTPGGIEGSRSA